MTGWLPTPYTVQRLEYAGTVKDELGNTKPAWLPPVDVPVHGWAPPSADDEPPQDGREAVVRDLMVLAPSGTVVAPQDRLVVDGVTYDVVGYPEDFTRGPFGFTAGVRITCKRAEG